MRRSIRIGRAPCSWPHRLPVGAAFVVLLSEPPKPPRKTATVRPHAQAGGSGPVSQVQLDALRNPLADRARPGMPLEPTPGACAPSGSRTMHSTPQRYLLHFMRGADLHPVKLFTAGHFRTRLDASLRLSDRREKSAASAASTGWRSDHFGTLEGATGGTQTHSRRTGKEARTTPTRTSRTSTSS